MWVPTGTTCAGLAFSKTVLMFADTLASSAWRTFEVTTHVQVLKPSGVTHIWLPAALIRSTSFQKTLANKFVADGGIAKITETKQDSLGILTATFLEHAKPALTLTSRVSLKNHSVDLAAPHNRTQASRSELEYYLRPSKYVPTDGIVKETADKAVGGREPISRKPARSMNGLWTILSAIRRCADAGAVTSASCLSPAISAASVPISMRFTSG